MFKIKFTYRQRRENMRFAAFYGRYSCECQSPVDTGKRLLTAIKKYL